VTVGELAIGYLAIGGALAVALARRARVRDIVACTVMWPIYAPTLLVGRNPGEDRLLGALRASRHSPLATMLPDDATARALAARVGDATARLHELDVVLARPEFDVAAAERRARELSARGATAAAATAQLRVRTLGQLRALRERYRAELEDVNELIAQLVAQAELVRLEPDASSTSAELVRELIARVEGLGELLAEHAFADAPAEYPRSPEG
jgi:hypothetical protein